jgi:hypothetical protein
MFQEPFIKSLVMHDRNNWDESLTYNSHILVVLINRSPPFILINREHYFIKKELT